MRCKGIHHLLILKSILFSYETMMYYTLFNCLMIVVVTEAHNQQSSCVPIPALSNQPSWISWCKANCGNPPGSHPACKKSSGIHAKCTCGPSSCTFRILSMYTTLIVALRKINILHAISCHSLNCR